VERQFSALEFSAGGARDANPESVDSQFIVEQAAIIRRVVARRLGRSCEEFEDICSQAILHLLGHLRAQESSTGAQPFSGPGYAAVVANHACDHYIRRRHPFRWRLRNRIRYVLEHDSRFAVWKSTTEVWVCGRAGWEARPAVEPPAARDLPAVRKHAIRELLLETFCLARGPVELSALVDLVAGIWGVPAFEHTDASEIEATPDTAPDAERALQQRRQLERAWSEIRGLPVRQRHALLLNLRDDALAILLTTSAVSFAGIAQVLEVDAAALAVLWNSLPLPDNEIAARLGCTRQQVINLRMAARKRLANRMAGWS
jgi:RNA polymerase sigma factor (sigma-70 family)